MAKLRPREGTSEGVPERRSDMATTGAPAGTTQWASVAEGVGGYNATGGPMLGSTDSHPTSDTQSASSKLRSGSKE